MIYFKKESFLFVDRTSIYECLFVMFINSYTFSPREIYSFFLCIPNEKIVE